MQAEHTLMYSEAAEAAAVADRQLSDPASPLRELGKRLRRMDPHLVVTCGRGSSDHAATFAKYLIETRALTPVASYAPSVSTLHATRWRKLDGALFLAISQSGQSPDIVLSAQAARESGALVVAIVNDPDSPLAREALFSTKPMETSNRRCWLHSERLIRTLWPPYSLQAEICGTQSNAMAKFQCADDIERLAHEAARHLPQAFRLQPDEVMI